MSWAGQSGRSWYHCSHSSSDHSRRLAHQLSHSWPNIGGRGTWQWLMKSLRLMFCLTFYFFILFPSLNTLVPLLMMWQSNCGCEAQGVWGGVLCCIYWNMIVIPSSIPSRLVGIIDHHKQTLLEKHTAASNHRGAQVKPGPCCNPGFLGRVGHFWGRLCSLRTNMTFVVHSMMNMPRRNPLACDVHGRNG